MRGVEFTRASAIEWVRRWRAPACAILLLAMTGIQCNAAASAEEEPAHTCSKPVYLTLDTGHMGIAEFVAEVLKHEKVLVTFFAAQEPTKEGDGSLGDHWAPWWKARAAEGHAFASHTWDHVYWRADVPSTGSAIRFRVKPSAGRHAGEESVMDAKAYCAELDHASARLQQITGQVPLPLFRAPGGKTSPALIAAARACGYAHVAWAPAGFLGDELPSESYSNALLLDRALRNVRPGDILMAHLGIWSRHDPWATADLLPLIQGLKARGFCFQTLRDHPDYRHWIERNGDRR